MVGGHRIKRMAMPRVLENKSILITGAASGIGAAAANLFAHYGARLLLIDRSDMVNIPLRSISICADIVDQVALRRALQEFGPIHCAFLNAGIEGLGGRMTPLDDYPDEEFDHVLQVNIRGLWNCLKSVVPILKAQGGGAIVTTASVLGWRSAAGMSAYVASKHAVVGLTRAAALDFARDHIRVNAVLPGAIETPMLTERGFIQNPEFAEFAAQAHPMGRLGQPKEVAEAAAWLLSDHASFITGHTLAVDGGLSAA